MAGTKCQMRISVTCQHGAYDEAFADAITRLIRDSVSGEFCTLGAVGYCHSHLTGITKTLHEDEAEYSWRVEVVELKLADTE